MARVLKPFDYFEPGTVEEAADILSKWGAKAQVLAGGVGLVDAMRRRVVAPECVVSIRSIPGLDYIRGDGDGGLQIGALASLRAAELSSLVQRGYLPLYEGIHHIPSLQVKCMGTVVGNLCVASPASDVVSPLIALGAELKIAGLGSPRTIPVESFFLGVNQTALQSGEVVAEVAIPAPAAGTGGAFLRLSRTATDVAKLNVAVMVRMVGSVCQDVRIALGAVAPTPIRAKKAEEALKGQRPEAQGIAAAAEAASEETSPLSDIRSTAEYRREMTRLLVRKALETALERAKG
jgi:carbon-monoxide dehydrogenase medium subunit